jgi:hypothetical protein
MARWLRACKAWCCRNAEGKVFYAKAPGIAEKVAEASTEGGFLGFGGIRVTDAEKASIVEVAKALGMR